MAEPSLTDLTENIAQNVKIYSDFLAKAGLPQPSHKNLPPPSALGPPPPLPESVGAALEVAKEATHELRKLLLNPVELVLGSVQDVSRSLTGQPSIHATLEAV